MRSRGERRRRKGSRAERKGSKGDPRRREKKRELRKSEKKKQGLRKSERDKTRAQGERIEEERKVQAQEGYEGKEEMTTQGECVEEKKEMNSMQVESDVSNRHMTWWKNAWWIRVDGGPHMRTARGRRRIWRAARRAAEQARDDDTVEETQSFAEEAEGRNGEREIERDRPDNATQTICTS